VTDLAEELEAGVIRLVGAEALTFEYAALRATLPPDGCAVAAMAKAYLDRHDRPRLDPIEEDEGAQPPPDEPVTVPGDVWIMGRHRLLCGDSTSRTDIAKLMGGDMADLVVTSPPYNQKIDQFQPSGMFREAGGAAWVNKVRTLAYADDLPEAEYQDQQRAAIAEWYRVVRDGGSLFYNHKNRYRDKQVISPYAWLPHPFRLRQEIIWARPGSITQNARMFLPCDERIFWMYKGDDFLFHDTTEIKSLSSVWRIALEANREHAVAFPLELPYRPIVACSNPGDIVLVPYCGSGTTMIAAEKAGRRCYGMERDPAYCDVIVARYEKATGMKAIKG